jgi:hypothetical protein
MAWLSAAQQQVEPAKKGVSLGLYCSTLQGMLKFRGFPKLSKPFPAADCDSYTVMADSSIGARSRSGIQSTLGGAIQFRQVNWIASPIATVPIDDRTSSTMSLPDIVACRGLVWQEKGRAAKS